MDLYISLALVLRDSQHLDWSVFFPLQVKQFIEVLLIRQEFILYLYGMS